MRTTGIRETFDLSTPLPPAEFVFRRIGPVMEHNYLCAACRDLNAVIETWWGVLQPCWKCQESGYTTITRVIKKDRLPGHFRTAFLLAVGIGIGVSLAYQWGFIPFLLLFVGLKIHFSTLPEIRT